MAVRGLCSFDDLAASEASRVLGFATGRCGLADDTPTTRDVVGAAMRGGRTLMPGQPVVDDTGQLAALDI